MWAHDAATVLSNQIFIPLQLESPAKHGNWYVTSGLNELKLMSVKEFSNSEPDASEAVLNSETLFMFICLISTPAFSGCRHSKRDQLCNLKPQQTQLLTQLKNTIMAKK